MSVLSHQSDRVRAANIIRAPLLLLELIAKDVLSLALTGVWLFYSVVGLGATHAEYLDGDLFGAGAGLLTFALAFVGLGYVAAAANPHLEVSL